MITYDVIVDDGNMERVFAEAINNERTAEDTFKILVAKQERTTDGRGYFSIQLVKIGHDGHRLKTLRNWQKA